MLNSQEMAKGGDRKHRKGHLILIGGAEDKKRDKVILRRVVKANHARVVAVIPSASRYPEDVARDYEYAFRDLGVERVLVVNLRYREDTRDARHLEALEQADAVFFSGGNQVRLVEILGDTPMLERIRERFHEGMTVAGTSAGAAAASDIMLYDGTRRGLMKGQVKRGRGFDFIQGITVDTHFLQRKRLSRLSHFLAAGYAQKGIGLDEDTALAINSRDVAETLGNGTVTMLSTMLTTFSDFPFADEGESISVNNLRLGFLSSGVRFCLRQWRIVKSVRMQKKVSMLN